jgi:hypothetical protein
MLNNYEPTENYLENELQVISKELKRLRTVINRAWDLKLKNELILQISLLEEEQMRISLLLFNGGF